MTNTSLGELTPAKPRWGDSTESASKFRRFEGEMAALVQRFAGTDKKIRTGKTRLRNV
jgi:hypothetical protein